MLSSHSDKLLPSVENKGELYSAITKQLVAKHIKESYKEEDQLLLTLLKGHWWRRVRAVDNHPTWVKRKRYYVPTGYSAPNFRRYTRYALSLSPPPCLYLFFVCIAEKFSCKIISQEVCLGETMQLRGGPSLPYWACGVEGSLRSPLHGFVSRAALDFAQLFGIGMYIHYILTAIQAKPSHQQVVSYKKAEFSVSLPQDTQFY